MLTLGLTKMASIPFFTNLQCDNALPWKKLIDQLEIGLDNFSNGEIEQPVRVMLPITEHSGFLGKSLNILLVGWAKKIILLNIKLILTP